MKKMVMIIPIDCQIDEAQHVADEIRSHASEDLGAPPTPPPEASRPPLSKQGPLLKAESVMLGIRHEKEGKLRVTYAAWDDAKVVLDGHVFRHNGAIDPPPS